MQHNFLRDQLINKNISGQYLYNNSIKHYSFSVFSGYNALISFDIGGL